MTDQERMKSVNDMAKRMGNIRSQDDLDRMPNYHPRRARISWLNVFFWLVVPVFGLFAAVWFADLIVFTLINIGWL